MPAGTKGLIHQITFVMVDATDFATVESGVVAASCTAKFYGVNHKDSVFTSGAISKAVTVVRSGIMGLILKATENNYDRMLVKITESDTGCADQHIVWQNESDMSVLLSMVSDLDSQIVIIDGTGSNLSTAIATQDTYLIGLSGAISDVESQLDVTASKVLLNQSRVSDILIDTATLAGMSNTLSQVLVDTADLSDMRSDIRSLVSTQGGTTVSAIWGIDASSVSTIGSIGSMLVKEIDGSSAFGSNVYSDLKNRIAIVDLVMDSTLSRVTLTQSRVSLLDSQITSVHSDIRSLVSTQGGTTVSAIWGIDASSVSTLGSVGSLIVKTLDDFLPGLSDTLSLVELRTSQLSNVQTGMSNILSQVLIDTAELSDFESNMLSRVPKEVASKSLLSDVRSDLRSLVSTQGGVTVSQIWGIDASSVSTLNSIGSLVVKTLDDMVPGISNTLSQVFVDTTGISDITSQILADTVGISDITSKILADTATLAGMSNTLSQVLVDTAAISDFESNLLSRIPKEVASKSLLSDVRSDLASQIGGITASVSVQDISDIASAVWAEKWRVHSLASSFGSLFSVVGSGVDVTESRILRTMSDTSDLVSRVTKEVASKSLLSDVRSDLRSLVSTQGGVTVSAIWGIDASSVSTVGSVGSLIIKTLDDMVPGISDTLSQVLVDTAAISDFESNMLSRVPKLVATQSQLSDVRSDLRSLVSTQGGVTVSQIWGVDASSVSTLNSIGSMIVKTLDDMVPGISDTLSQVLVDTATLAGMSNTLSQVLVDTAELSDFESNMLSRVPKLVASQSLLSDVSSNLRSQAVAVQSDIRSLVSTQGGVTVSAIWGIDSSSVSTLGSIGSLIVKTLDDTIPQIASDASDIASRVTGAVATKSQVASAVWAEKWRVHSLASSFGSLVSVIGTGVDVTESRTLRTMSDTSLIPGISDILSQVLVDTADLSDMRSDIRSLVSTQGGTTVSAIWGIDASSVSTLGSIGSLVVKTLDDMIPGISDTLSQVLVDTAAISDFESNMLSRVPKEVASKSLLSDVESNLRSQAVAVQSDVRSLVSTQGGTTVSAIWGIDASSVSTIGSVGSLIVKTLDDMIPGMSDVLSQVLVDTAAISDFESNMLSRVPKELASKSLLSDVHSDLRSQISGVGGGTASNIASVVWAVNPSSISGASTIGSLVVKDMEDLVSRVTGAIATKSDFVSAVWNANPSSISAASTIGSLVVKVLDDTLSDYHSDLRSLISGIGGGTASNIASVVWAANPSSISAASTIGSLFVKTMDDMVPGISDTLSQVLVDTATLAGMSNILSQVLVDTAELSDFESNMLSRVPKEVASKSLLSDVHSDLRSEISGIGGGTASNIASVVWAVNPSSISAASTIGSLMVKTLDDTIPGMSDILSQVLVDTAAISDFESNMLSRVPKEVASKSLLSDAHSDLRSQISGIGGGTASNIASVVWAVNPSSISAASTMGSLLVKGIDDTLPQIASDASDLASRITAAPATKSDLVSAIWGVDASSISTVGSVGSLIIKTLDDMIPGMSDTLSQVLVDTTAISDFESNMLSRVPKEIASKSLLSDVRSDLRSLVSTQGGTTVSAIWGIDASSVSTLGSIGSLVVKSLDDGSLSDITSKVTATDTVADNIYSLLSDHDSNMQSRVTKEVASKSLLSDVESNLRSQAVAIQSDIRSQTSTVGGVSVSQMWGIDASSVSTIGSIGSLVVKTLDDMVPGMSDAISQVLADTATLAGMSNTLSQVLVDTADISDFESQMLSRVPKEVASKSLMSDVESNLRSQAVAVQSDVRSLVSTTGGTSVSAIWGIDASSVSTLGSIGSLVVKSLDGGSLSDITSKVTATDTVADNIYSLLSDHDSNIQSRVPKEVASKSLLSDVNSNMLSYLGGMSGAISDIESQVDATDTVADNIYSLLSDHDSNMQSRVTKEVASKSLMSDVESNVRSLLVGLNASVSDIESAVDALMGTDTLTELGAIPSATPTRDEALLYLYQYFRNKRTQTSSRLVMFKDDGSTELASAVISDDATTFTKGEFGTP